MTKKSRDYIFLMFVVLFVVGTVLISLYASGYKINLSWPPRPNRILIKTGMIALNSSPRGAAVSLDGRMLANFSLNPWSKEYLTTPTKVKNVLPGEYDLRLELPGYLPLEKKIRVYSGQTTFVEDINLFRQDAPFLVTEATTSALSLSPNRKYLYADSSRQIITLRNNQVRTLAAGTPAGAWLTNQDKLLAGGRLFSPAEGGDLDYLNLIGPKATDWRMDENTNRLYYVAGNSLAYLDLNKQTSAIVLSGRNISAYEPRGDRIYFISDEGDKLALARYSIAAQKTEQEIALPKVGHYIFSSDGRSPLSVYDDRNRTLYIINPDNLADYRAISNVSSWQWIDDNTLFYNNHWEIYSYDRRQNSSSLLIRVGEEIKQIIWNPNKNYLIYSTAKDLNAYDLKMGIATNFFRGDQVASPVFNEDNDTLFFWAKIGREEGVYSLVLQ